MEEYTEEQMDEIIKNHSQDLLRELPEHIMVKAIDLIKKAISEEDQLKIRRAFEKDPNGWYIAHHMGLGLDVRNYIRLHLGHDESVFGFWGLDGYWSPITEFAVGAREYPVKKPTDA